MLPLLFFFFFFKTLNSHLTQADLPGGLCTLGEKILEYIPGVTLDREMIISQNDRTVKHSHNRNFSEEIFCSSETTYIVNRCNQAFPLRLDDDIHNFYLDLHILFCKSAYVPDRMTQQYGAC